MGTSLMREYLLRPQPYLEVPFPKSQVIAVASKVSSFRREPSFARRHVGPGRIARVICVMLEFLVAPSIQEGSADRFM